MKDGPGTLGIALLALAGGGGGATMGLLIPGSQAWERYRIATLPGSEIDPHVPFPWSPRALSPIELQAMGLDRAIQTLVLVGLCLLAVGVISAALYAFLEASAGRRMRAIHGLVGASPWRLFGQGLARALLAVLVGVSIGLGIAVGSVHVLLEAWPGDVADGAPSSAFLVLCIGGGALLVLLGATLPLVRVFRPGWLGDGLAPHARTNPGLDARTVQGITVTGQLLVTITLLYGAGLFLTTVEASAPAGLKPQGNGAMAELVVLPVKALHMPPHERSERYGEFLKEVVSHPNVVSAGIASRGALGGRGTLDWVLRPVEGDLLLGTQAEYHAATPEWFDTLGVTIRGHPPGRDAVVVNATMGRLVAWEGPETEEALQTPLGLGGSEGIGAEMVGLLEEDVPIAAPGWGRLYRVYPWGQITSRTPPVIYLSFEQYPPERAELLIRISSGAGPNGIQGAARGSLPDLQLLKAFEVEVGEAANRRGLSVSSASTVVETFAELAAPGRWFRSLSGGLSLLAMGLAVVGVAAAVRATTRLRVAELGVRRAVGGSRARVAAGVLFELTLPLAVAAWLGLGTAVAAGEALVSFLGSGSSFNLPLYLASLVALVLATFLGALGPLLGATSVPPAEAIRRGEGVEGAELV